MGAASAYVSALPSLKVDLPDGQKTQASHTQLAEGFTGCVRALTASKHIDSAQFQCY